MQELSKLSEALVSEAAEATESNDTNVVLLRVPLNCLLMILQSLLSIESCQ